LARVAKKGMEYDVIDVYMHAFALCCKDAIDVLWSVIS
jgi:hypothetical protein